MALSVEVQWRLSVAACSQCLCVVVVGVLFAIDTVGCLFCIESARFRLHGFAVLL